MDGLKNLDHWLKDENRQRGLEDFYEHVKFSMIRPLQNQQQTLALLYEVNCVHDLVKLSDGKLYSAHLSCFKVKPIFRQVVSNFYVLEVGSVANKLHTNKLIFNSEDFRELVVSCNGSGTAKIFSKQRWQQRFDC